MIVTSRQDRGSALIGVLWLAAVLSAVVFTLSATVRGEIDLVSTKLDSTRAYYLATGAIDRSLLRIHWGTCSSSTLHFQFPSGTAEVTILAENKKANINTIQPEGLSRLLLTLGTSSSDASGIAASPRFAPGHPPIGHLEEILAIPAITPDVYFGHFSSSGGDKATWLPGLRDKLTAFPSANVFTLRATAELKSRNSLEAPRRTVMATVELQPTGVEPYFAVLRWYDDAASMGAP